MIIARVATMGSRKRFRVFGRWVFLLCLLFSLFLPQLAHAKGPEGGIVRVVLKGTVNPGSADYLSRALAEASRRDAAAVLVELDTPGGLVRSLRAMVQEIMASPVPVIVYVAPAGAQAASAGALLMLSAHVAAMSPGTEIGAAHPVGIGLPGSVGKDDVSSAKAVNDLAAFARSLAEERGRNASWAEEAVRKSEASSAREALAGGVVDVVAADRGELLRVLEGRVVKTASGSAVLSLSTLPVYDLEPGFREEVLMTLANPDLAYLFFLAGLLGLYFEFSNPGAIFPGVAGAVSLLLGLYAMQALSVNAAGLMLLVLAVAFLVLELFVASGGLLAAGGLIALFIASLMLFNTPESGLGLSLSVFVPVFAAFSAAVAFILFSVMRSAVRKPFSGMEGLAGEVGIVVRPIGDARAGKVHIHGELWDAVSSGPVPEGAHVVVERVEGLLLHVSIAKQP